MSVPNPPAPGPAGTDRTTPPAATVFDVGLQPERTALAWRRTGLALGVAALGALRVLPATFGPWGFVPAVAGLLGAVAVVGAAHRRYRAAHTTLVSDGDRAPLPSGTLPLITAALVVLGGLATLGLALTL